MVSIHKTFNLIFTFRLFSSSLSILHICKVTELLIKHGADVNAKDLWAFTPIQEAASKSRVEVCSLLLSEKADPTLVNCHGKTAIDSAPTRELQERIACKYNST